MLSWIVLAACAPRTELPVDPSEGVTTGPTEDPSDSGDDTVTTSPWTFIGCRVVEVTVVDGDDVDTFTYEYNARGDEVLRTWDLSTDGLIDGSVARTYDGSGRTLLLETDSDGDGDIDRRTSWTFSDPEGSAVQDDDFEADGIVDSRTKSFYDGAGLLVRRDVDSPVDGVVDSTSGYEYDEAGRLVRTEHSAKGVVTLVESDTYGPSGEHLEALFENVVTGHRARTVFTYDAELRLLTKVEDDGDDGSADLTTTYTYAGGLLTTIEEVTGTGFLDLRLTYAYDEGGRTASQLYEDFYAGWVEVSFDTYTYDAEAQLVSVASDEGFDGEVDWLYTHTYDEHGNLLSHRVQQLVFLLDEEELVDFTNTAHHTVIDPSRDGETNVENTRAPPRPRRR